MLRPRLVVGMAVVGVVAAVLSSACTPTSSRSTPAYTATAPPADEDHLDWAATEPAFIVVRKACRTLDVYRYGQRIRSFAAVFGLGGLHQQKLYQGDMRTPVGLYSIIDMRPHPRWRYFMLLDYPNVTDQQRYAAAVEDGYVPREGDGFAGMGGEVGIHGTDKPDLNRQGVDWTWGCISLANPDVEELYDLVYVGTPVLIEE